MSLLDILACPLCKSRVRSSGDGLICISCEKKYPIVNGVPVMLPDSGGANVPYEKEQVTKESYTPYIEGIIMQSLTDQHIVLDAGCGNMLLDDPCIIRMDVQLTPYVDVVGDLLALPFLPGSIDFIFALSVFEHLRQPFSAADQIYGALKPGGYVYADSNFVFTYHGYPENCFNASISGLRRLFSQFRELRAGVPPYQMPSFAIENVFNTYLTHFKASDFTERVFVLLAQILLEFPLRYYDRKFDEGASFRLAAGNYFCGIKQPQGNETIFPSIVMDLYSRSPELKTRYPDPTNLTTPDNLMTWAKTEGSRRYPEIASFLDQLKPFSKYIDPSRVVERKIASGSGLIDPDKIRHFGVKKNNLMVWRKIFRMIFQVVSEAGFRRLRLLK